MDQRISGSAVDGAPTEEPRPDASNARSQRPATRHKGNWQLACPVLCSCLCVETPVVALRCFTLPRSSILCGCIKFPGKKGNAVWGRYPTACTVYVKKKLGVHWLGARGQNLSRLRVEKLGCATRKLVLPRHWPACGSSGRSGRQTRSSNGHARARLYPVPPRLRSSSGTPYPVPEPGF
jgi:hypothetical protein